MKRVACLVMAAGCSSVLGLDDYSNAIDQLCKCDTELDFLADCRARLSSRLSGVSEPTREKWLAFYSANCAGACLNARECYDQPGTCATIACSSDQECCGSFTGEGSCNVSAGVCNP